MKISFHKKDRTITLHHVDVEILRSILCAASLHAYDDMEYAHAKIREAKREAEANYLGLGDVIRRNIQYEYKWYTSMRTTIKAIENLIIPPRREVKDLEEILKGGNHAYCGICGGYLINGECHYDIKAREIPGIKIPKEPLRPELVADLQKIWNDVET